MRNFHLLFTVVLFFSCSAARKCPIVSNHKLDLECYLVEEDFEVDPAVYQYFKVEVEDFFDASHSIDLLHFTSWSGKDKVEISRIFKSSNGQYLMRKSRDGQLIEEILDLSSDVLEWHMIKDLSTSQVMQLCKNFRSSPFTNFYFIKVNGELKFKYHASSTTYDELSSNESKKIEQEIDLMNILDTYAPHF